MLINTLTREDIPMKREYEVIFQEVEDGWIMATVPDLPGAVTQGKDMAEARAMIKEAVELLLESYRENAHNDVSGKAI
jgi:predicted RNase H-like HicB family nuclease